MSRIVSSKLVVFLVFCLTIVVLLLVITGCAAAPVQPYYASWNHYGTDFQLQPTPLSKLDFDKAGPVFTTGTILEVCPKKGCWFTFTEGGVEVRVKFKDYGFFVPRNAQGHNVILEGWGNKAIMPVADAKHMAEEAGKSQAEIDAITADVEIYEIEATAVYIDGDGLDKPFEQPAAEGITI